MEVFGRVCRTSYKLVLYQYRVPGPSDDCLASKGPFNPYQGHRVPAATVTTTVAVTYTGNIGVMQPPS